jgi:PIN domain nuclease of toxin-antitoxin system
MKVLLDAHALLWALLQPETLKPRCRDLLSGEAERVCYSPVNLWELAIKRAKGGLQFDDAVVLQGLKEQEFDELPVTTRHCLEAAALPRLHGDPFDRLLIAQARVEGLTLISRDRLFRRYDVPLLEA